MEKSDTIQTLTEIFAEEVEAALRYLHLAVTIKGIDRLVVQKSLLDGVQETIDHARVVAEKILEIGGVPSLDIRIQLPAEMTTGKDATSGGSISRRKSISNPAAQKYRWTAVLGISA